VRVQARARANRCGESRSALSKARHDGSVLSGAVRHWVGGSAMPCRLAQAIRNSKRRKTSWVVPPSSPDGAARLPLRDEELNAAPPFGEDGGTILARGIVRTPRTDRRCVERQLAVGLDPMRRCPWATMDVRGTNDFGEGSSSPSITTKRGGSALKVPRGTVASQCSEAARVGVKAGADRGCIGIGWPKWA